MDEQKEIAVRDESLPFKLMDALDDQLIIAELEGRMPEILTYHFNDGSKEVWGLSKAGVDEATGELARQGEVIREMELLFEDGVDESFFQVKAGRYAISKDGKEVLLDTKFGVKRQAKLTPKGNPNTFWYEQGAIKACRNASMRLIPKTIVQAVIENAKKKGKVKEVKQEEEQAIPIITSLIDSITKRDGVKNDKPYTVYTLHVGDQKITTFSETLAKTAKEFVTKKESAVIEYKTTKYGMELVSIIPVGTEEKK